MAETSTVLNLMALSALLPAAFIGARKAPVRDAVFWLLLAVAFVGPFMWIITEFAAAWRTDLSAALWLSIAATMAIFGFTAAFDRDAWQLAPILWPLMLGLGILAAIWSGHAASKPIADQPSGWIVLHIAVSVATYALVTLAAVAASAGILQERAMKAKKPTSLTRALPPITACDYMVIRLLAIAETVLVLGLITGMTLNYAQSGQLIEFDHKSILAFAAFALIGALLIAHRVSGLRGRKAARWVLAAYLVLTLGYPGVKFVTDVIIG